MAANDYFPDLPDTEDFMDEFAQRMANHTMKSVYKYKGDEPVKEIRPDFNQINRDDPETSMIDDDEVMEEQW